MAITRYRVDLEHGYNWRPGEKKPVLDRLAALSEVHAKAAAATRSLPPEELARLRHVIKDRREKRKKQQKEERQGDSRLEAIEPVADIRDDLADVALVAHKELEAEVRERGRLYDLAARRLVFRLSLVRRELADGRMPRSWDDAPPGEWFRYVNAVLGPVCQGKGAKFAREVADYWRERDSDCQAATD